MKSRNDDDLSSNDPHPHDYQSFSHLRAKFKRKSRKFYRLFIEQTESYLACYPNKFGTLSVKPYYQRIS